MANGKRVVVIGGGPGGYPAAFLASDLGMQVTLVEAKPNPGGVCLFQGCIPSKALLHVAKLLNEAKEASQWGLSFEPPTIDLAKLRSWKQGVVGKLTGGLGQMSRNRKVNFVRGRARFLDAHALEIAREDGASEKLDFDYAIIATGSVPAKIPGLPTSDRIMDSTATLELNDIPKKLLVVGGGYIGLELGTVYSALGSKVTVVEATGGLLPGADRDLVAHVQKKIEERFERVLLNTSVQSMREEGEGIRVKLLGTDLPESEPLFDKVLVSVGRKPMTEGLGLDRVKVKQTSRGFIEVDAQRRTSEPHIFAIGDVAGDPMLAHKATYEGRIAAEVIAGKSAAFDARAIPAVVFTDPELAWAGLTETEARKQGRDYKLARFPWSASGRATTMGRNDGLTKMVIDPRTEQVLGVGVVGVGAGEMIAEAVLAIELGARATDLMMTIHAHPTLSETVMEAAEVYFGHSPHLYQQPA